MCGIVGALSLGEFRITDSYITAMRDKMAHRGPDGAATWVDVEGRVGLGHRRLAIVDLSTAATQPMSNPNNTLWVVFNGEIYNHADIRRQLTALGYTQWQTDHSDTEVLLRAFEHWGIDCVHHFRGMFAFAIWDARQQQLWLARDHVGIKPLYFSTHHQRIVFASEIKAILKDPEQPRAVNHEALYHYLTFLTTPAPTTLFAGIQKLEPGTWMRVDSQGQVKTQRYWDVLDHITPLQAQSDEEIADIILSSLQESVQLRKMSDVPVGVFLSGGIDSSTNAVLFAAGNPQPIKTFSIGYQGNYQSYSNELHFARQVAEQIGADHHERLLTVNDLLDFLPRMVQLQDEPIADPVCVPVYYVSKLARDNGVTVCQLGEGADELFCGYPSWKTYLHLQRLSRLPGTLPLQKLALKMLTAFGKDHRMEYELLRRSVNQLPIFWGGAQAFSEVQKQRLLSTSLKQELSGLTSWEAIAPIWKRFHSKSQDCSTLQWMSYLDLCFRLPELLLMRVDKMSMGVGLEGRVPFLDRYFVAQAMSIPTKVKVRNGTLKYILKRAVRNVIPEQIINRKKQGFGVPIYEWFFGKLGERTRQELNYFCQQTDFLNKEAVDQLLNQGAGSHVWYLLNLALWWKEYIS